MAARVDTDADFAKAHFMSISDVADHYEIVVIGAGPAGTLAALLTARAGMSVLLVERQPLPRFKVCGCCLSFNSLNVLRECGLDSITGASGAPELNTLIAHYQNRKVRIPLPGFRALSRANLDLALAAASMRAGAACLPATTAKVFPPQTGDDRLAVELCSETLTRSIQANVVIAADGLAGTSLAGFAGLQPVIAPRSRLGIAAVSEAGSDFYSKGNIYMACSDRGYVGVVRLEHEHLEIAAALDAGCLHADAPSAVVASILSSCNFPLPRDLRSMIFKGTPPLTRKRATVSDRRVFVIGDSASYAEPFTGEGIAWALESGRLVAPLAVRAARRWEDCYVWQWQHVYRRSIQARQRSTKLVAALLRQPALLSIAGDTVGIIPGLARGLSNVMCGSGI